ncbi:MAG TPA: methyltransferase domain-containing protein [Oculatellaceae cyanobacterium]|jgi:hypothetical protein
MLYVRPLSSLAAYRLSASFGGKISSENPESPQEPQELFRPNLHIPHDQFTHLSPDPLTINFYRENAVPIADQAIRQAVHMPERSISKYFENAFGHLPEGSTVADIGAGSGSDAQLLSAVYGFNVHAIEPVPELRHLAANEYPTLKERLRDGHLPNGLPSDLKGKCKGLLLSSTLQHIPKAQMPLAVKNLKELLDGPGSVVLVSMPFGQQDYNPLTGRDSRGCLQVEYTPEQFTKYFTDAGFERTAFYGQNTDPAKREPEEHVYIFELKN